MLTLSPSARLPGTRYTFVCLLFALLLFPFIVPDLMACHKGKPHGRNAEPCGDGGGNPNPPAEGTAAMQLIDAAPHPVTDQRGLEMEPVACASGALSANSGIYLCEETSIMFQTSNFTGTFNKKHFEICSTYQSGAWLTLDVDTLTAGWTDDCSDGSCGIEVRMIFSESIFDDTGGAADQLEAVFFGTATGTAENPFLVAQDIKLESFDFVFSTDGSRRSAGNCSFYASDLILNSMR